MFSMTEARARFEARFPEFNNKARKYFSDYKPEARDEATANVLFLTWHNFVSLVQNGKADEGLLTSVFFYSCHQTRSGRMLRTVRNSKARELFDYARRSGHVIARGIDMDAYIGRGASVLDIVAFRIDTQAWLDSLTEVQRTRAIELADGSSTKELAERWNVSQPAVSFYRRQLNRSFEKFMGE